MKQVEELKQTRGVLVYATGELYDKLALESKLTLVTEATPHEDLRKMDVKTNGVYPVYLLDEDYAIRGLDYRAANNRHGITMIICSAFRDRRTRVQAPTGALMLRGGAHGAHAAPTLIASIGHPGVHDNDASLAAAPSVVFWCIGNLGLISRDRCGSSRNRS